MPYIYPSRAPVSPTLTALGTAHYAIAAGQGRHASDPYWLTLDYQFWGNEPKVLLKAAAPDGSNGQALPRYATRPGMSGTDGVYFEGTLEWAGLGAAEELVYYWYQMFPQGGAATLFALDSRQPNTTDNYGRGFRWGFYDCIIWLPEKEERIYNQGGYLWTIPIKAATRRTT